jgi:hypothetical protein
MRGVKKNNRRERLRGPGRQAYSKIQTETVFIHGDEVNGVPFLMDNIGIQRDGVQIAPYESSLGSNPHSRNG